MSLFLRIAEIVIVLAALVGLSRQVRKPGRLLGMPFAWLMNLSHKELMRWGLKQGNIGAASSILDIGCGGGATVKKMAISVTRAKVYGVDCSEGSLAVARIVNGPLIRDGRVVMVKAAMPVLPFPDGQFDLVTAFETQYYWPDLPGSLREILRVLQPGGTLLVVAEFYKREGARNRLQQGLMKFLGSTNLSVEDQRELFSGAGFVDVRVLENRAKGWIAVRGMKINPSS